MKVFAYPFLDPLESCRRRVVPGELLFDTLDDIADQLLRHASNDEEIDENIFSESLLEQLVVLDLALLGFVEALD